MSAVIDFLKTIVDFLKTVVDVIITLCKDLVEFIQNLLKMPEFFSTLFSGHILPPVVLSVISVLVVTMILLRVLGRDGG